MRFQISNLGFAISDFKFEILDLGFDVSDLGFEIDGRVWCESVRCGRINLPFAIG